MSEKDRAKGKTTMIEMSHELKQKLLDSKSAEDAAKLVKEFGQEISTEGAALLWEEIERARQGVQEFSKDELDAVSGGKFEMPEGYTLVFSA